MFISQASKEFLGENGFNIIENNDSLTISHQRSINFLWPVTSVILGLCLIPLVALGNFKLALLVILLVIFPVYKALKELKQPKYVELNAKQKYVLIKNKLGKNTYFRFENMEGISLGTFDESLEPNAFQDEVVARHYYIDLSLDNGSTKTIMGFKEVEKNPVMTLISELEKVFIQSKVASA